MREPISGPNFAFTGYVYGGREMSMGTFIHETAGHAFGLLGDEYSTSGFDPGQPFEIPDYEATRLSSEQKKGWYLNLSLSSDPIGLLGTSDRTSEIPLCGCASRRILLCIWGLAI